MAFRLTWLLRIALCLAPRGPFPTPNLPLSMDRKNLFLALACFGGAFAFYIFGTPRAAGPAATSAPATVAAKAPAPSAAAGKPGATGVAPPTAALAREKAAFVTLENEFIRVTFTTRGGAIERVEMLKEFADTERKAKVIFNQGNPDAALTLVVENRATRAWEQVLGEFKVVAKTDQSLTLAGALADGTKVERVFSLARRASLTPSASRPGSSRPSPASPPRLSRRPWVVGTPRWATRTISSFPSLPTMARTPSARAWTRSVIRPVFSGWVPAAPN